MTKEIVADILTQAAKEAEEARKRAEATDTQKRGTDELCLGSPRTFELSNGGPALVINPNSCQVRWRILSGCIKAFDKEGKVIALRACSGSEATVPDGIYSVTAIDGNAQVWRIECKPFAPGNLPRRLSVIAANAVVQTTECMKR